VSAIKVAIGFDPIKAEVDLVEFIKLIREITSIKVDRNTKEAINKAIADVYYAYEMIVNTLTPFIAAKNKQEFKEEFSNEYAKFANIHLKTGYEHRITDCGTTYEMINKLAKNRGWRSKIRGGQEKLKRLRKLADGWLLNHKRIYKAMKKYHFNLERELNVIYKNLDNKALEDSREELQSVLDKYSSINEKISPCLDELLKVSKQL
jgi:hypothetical protein